MKKKKLCLSLLLVFLGPAVSPLNADSSIELTGCRVKNFYAVNGTFSITFWLQSEQNISGVVLSYVDTSEKWANATMTLVEGNETSGWWEVTEIRPNVFEEKNATMTVHYLDDMRLYVYLPDSLIELTVKSDNTIGSWATSQTRIFSTAFPFVSLISGIAISGLVTGILLKRHRTLHISN
jgi:hypothetical protein